MNTFQDGCIQPPRYGHLGHLEGGVARTRHHLGADLDQFLPERGQRPVTHVNRKLKPTKKVAEVVGQGKQLKLDLNTVCWLKTRHRRSSRDGRTPLPPATARGTVGPELI